MKSKRPWFCACGKKKTEEDEYQYIEKDGKSYKVCLSYPECGEELLDHKDLQKLKDQEAYAEVKLKIKESPEEWEIFKEKRKELVNEGREKIAGKLRELKVLKKIRDDHQKELEGE